MNLNNALNTCLKCLKVLVMNGEDETLKLTGEEPTKDL